MSHSHTSHVNFTFPLQAKPLRPHRAVAPGSSRSRCWSSPTHVSTTASFTSDTTLSNAVHPNPISRALSMCVRLASVKSPFALAALPAYPARAEATSALTGGPRSPRLNVTRRLLVHRPVDRLALEARFAGFVDVRSTGVLRNLDITGLLCRPDCPSLATSTQRLRFNERSSCPSPCPTPVCLYTSRKPRRRSECRRVTTPTSPAPPSPPPA